MIADRKLMPLWSFQDEAVGLVERHWSNGVRGVCLVSPTGSGKTVMAEALIERGQGTTLFLTHTRELVAQSAERLNHAGIRTGVIAAGHPRLSGCRCYVASIQTLVARELMPLCDHIVIDEAHHFVSDDWGALIAKYPFTPRVGLTATPERADGRPLGEAFDEIVVAASYTQLTELGHLVPVRLLRPQRELDKGIATDPVEAYLTRGEGRRGFIYCRSVQEAQRVASELSARGVPSACVEANTPGDLRRKYIAQFKYGELKVLTNMQALTEGINIPEASLCIIARNMGHVSTYLQAAGRVLRAASAKNDALIIDLPGISHRFGAPNENRRYSLEGEGICRSPTEALRICLHCGMTFVPTPGKGCPRCGETNPQDKRWAQRIYNEELYELFNGPGTPEWVKQAELARLESVAAAKGFNDAWVARQYRASFQELPTLRVAEDRKKSEYHRLVKLADERGYRREWASHRYRSTYNAYPPRSWAKELSNGHPD